jgi:hypothetical protein
MTLCVALEELPMNDVNVFPNINDHKFIGLCFAFPRLCSAYPGACPGFRFEKGTNLNDSLRCHISKISARDRHWGPPLFIKEFGTC